MTSKFKLIFLHLLLLWSFEQSFGDNLIFEVSSLKLNHKQISINSIGQKVELFSKYNDLFIEMIPIKGDAIQYKYQLKNYELDWTTTNFPVVRYMNLPTGEYNLQIIAFQKKIQIGSFNLTVNVKKSLTDVWWFYPMLVLYAILLISGAIYLFFLYNFRQKMKVQKLRSKIAADLHDEVGSTLNSIGISAKIIQKKIGHLAPELKTILSQMEADSEETIDNIRDTVWALNSENDSVDILNEKINSFARQVFDNKGIEFIFENNLEGKKWPKINIETRKNVYLIVKEAINNIAKHAEASLVKISFVNDNDEILINISDNGKGFDTNKSSEGNGLKNYKMRAKESFLALKIESKLKLGTKILIKVPKI